MKTTTKSIGRGMLVAAINALGQLPSSDETDEQEISRRVIRALAAAKAYKDKVHRNRNYESGDREYIDTNHVVATAFWLWIDERVDNLDGVDHDSLQGLRFLAFASGIAKAYEASKLVALFQDDEGALFGADDGAQFFLDHAEPIQEPSKELMMAVKFPPVNRPNRTPYDGLEIRIKSVKKGGDIILSAADQEALHDGPILPETPLAAASDISGLPGIKIETREALIALSQDEFARFLSFSLTKDEYLALRTKYGIFEQISAKYYDESGNALVPKT